MSNHVLNKVLKHTLKIFLIAIILYFVGIQLSNNIDVIKNYQWSIDPLWIIISIIAHLITLLSFSKVWCFLISGFGYNVPLKYAFKISYITNLGRYIPGKIWPIFGMAYYAKKIKIPEQTAIASWTIAMLFALPSAFFVVFAGMLIKPGFVEFLLPEEYKAIFYIFALFTFFASLILIIKPKTVFKLYNLLLRLLKKSKVNFKLSPLLALKIFLGYSVCWIFYGISFYFLLKSLGPTIGIDIFQPIIIFVLAYQIGYLAFFAPGGIGVRELVLTKGLASFFGDVAIGVSIVARIWNLIVEIISALIALIIKIENDK